MNAPVPDTQLNPAVVNRRLAEVRATIRSRAAGGGGVIELLSGEGEVFDPATSRLHAAERGAYLCGDMQLRLATGRALVRLDDGSDVWLAAGSTLGFGPWDRGSRHIRLLAGRLLAIIAEAADRPFHAHTSIGEVFVTGTAFELSTAAGAFQVDVLHGSVEVRTQRGTAHATRGNTVSASQSTAPKVDRIRRDKTRPHWAGSIAQSSSNNTVRHAFGAVATHLGANAPDKKESPMNTRKPNRGRIILLVLCGGLIATGALWFVARERMLAKKGPWEHQTILFRAVHDDGSYKDIDIRDTAAIERALQKMNEKDAAEARAMLKEAMDKALADPPRYGDHVNVIGVGGPATEWDKAVYREMEAGTALLKLMVANGRDPQQAKSIAERAMADSLLKQAIAAHPDEAHVRTEVTFTQDPAQIVDGKSGWTISTRVGVADEEPPPGVTIDELLRYEETGELPAGWTREELDAWLSQHGEK